MSDTTIHVPRDWHTFVPPAASGSYVDALSGRTIRRITGAAQHGSGWITPEYSTVDCQAGRRFLLAHQDHFGLWDDTGFLRDLPLRADSEPRFSRTDGDVLYYLRGNALYSYDGAEVDAVVRTFPEYSKISGMGEGDLLGDLFVFCGDDREIFTFLAGEKSPVLPVGWWPTPLDSLYATPDGNVLVAWKDIEGQRGCIHLFDRNMKPLRQVAPVDGHHDVGRNSDGEECMFWCSSNHPTLNKNAIIQIRLRDNEWTPLLELPWNQAVSCSCYDGGVIVATYGAVEPGPDWGPYTGELLSIAWDGTVERLAHHRSRARSYESQPKATINRAGQRILFASDMDRSQTHEHYADTYALELGPAPDNPPILAMAAAPEPDQRVLDAIAAGASPELARFLADRLVWR